MIYFLIVLFDAFNFKLEVNSHLILAVQLSKGQGVKSKIKIFNSF